MAETNLMEVSNQYHSLKVDVMDDILTEDFVGRHPASGHEWRLSDHKKTWSEMSASDTIKEQIASGDKVWTSFVRDVVWDGVPVSIDAISIKTFRDGKICRIDEFYDRKQVEDQVAAAKAR